MAIFSMFIIIGVLFSIYCVSRSCLNRGCVAVVFPTICSCISLFFSISIISFASSTKTSFEEDKLLIEDLYGNAECGDLLSSGISSIMYEQVEGRSDAGIDGASVLFVYGIFVLLQTLFAALVLCGVWRATRVCSKKKPEKVKSP